MIKLLINIVVLFSLYNSQLVAQELSWKKLVTEPYAGKQDDITFVDENTGWYGMVMAKYFILLMAQKHGKKQLEQKGSFFRTIAFLDKMLDLLEPLVLIIFQM
jgi:hypothetical protein